MHPGGAMDPAREKEDARAALERLGIAVPAQDLPFLQRTLLRQRELMAVLAADVPGDTEPAHVFKVPD